MHTLFKRFPIAIWPVVIAVIILFLEILGRELSLALRLEQQAVFNGQWWRMITAHWVHLGWNHTLLNGAGLLLLAWLQPKGNWWKWLGFYLITSLCISIYLVWCDKFYSYAGASGVLHGLFILAAYYSQWLEPWRKKLMLLLVSAKLIWEQTPYYSDSATRDIIGGVVAVDAHLIGGVCGLMTLTFFYIKRQKKTAQ